MAPHCATGSPTGSLEGGVLRTRARVIIFIQSSRGSSSTPSTTDPPSPSIANVDDDGDGLLTATSMLRLSLQHTNGPPSAGQPLASCGVANFSPRTG
eukprot:6993531-Pyramimonas_sp.AAC.1